MSPKECSLAYEELEEQVLTDERNHFVPQLNILVKTNKFSSTVTHHDVFEVSGRITISF